MFVNTFLFQYPDHFELRQKLFELAKEPLFKPNYNLVNVAMMIVSINSACIHWISCFDYADYGATERAHITETEACRQHRIHEMQRASHVTLLSLFFEKKEIRVICLLRVSLITVMQPF